MAKKITLYRDTGAWQSLIVRNKVQDVPTTATDRSFVIQPVGGGYCTVLLHKLRIESSLVSGYVLIGVVDSLPIQDVDILLGNELTDMYYQNDPHKSVVVGDSLVLADIVIYTNIMPACVTTRSMSKASKRNIDEIDLGDTFEGRILQSGDIDPKSDIICDYQALSNTLPNGDKSSTSTCDGLIAESVSWSKDIVVARHKKDDKSLQNV